MKKSAWYVVLLLVVLILALVVSMSAVLSIGNDDKGEEPGSSVSSGDDVSGEPDIILPLVTPDEEPEPSPEPSEEPEETPEPSPEPSEEPEESPAPSEEPLQNISASGSFASDTGTGLNLQVDWSAYSAEDGIMLQVDVGASSYSFFTSALYNAIELTVNGITYYANSPEIAIEDNELQLTPMAGFTIPVEAGSASIDVVWHYRGSYSGVELEEITASGSAYIG